MAVNVNIPEQLMQQFDCTKLLFGCNLSLSMSATGLVLFILQSLMLNINTNALIFIWMCGTTQILFINNGSTVNVLSFYWIKSLENNCIWLLSLPHIPPIFSSVHYSTMCTEQIYVPALLFHPWTPFLFFFSFIKVSSLFSNFVVWGSSKLIL